MAFLIKGNGYAIAIITMQRALRNPPRYAIGCSTNSQHLHKQVNNMDNYLDVNAVDADYFFFTNDSVADYSSSEDSDSDGESPSTICTVTAGLSSSQLAALRRVTSATNNNNNDAAVATTTTTTSTTGKDDGCGDAHSATSNTATTITTTTTTTTKKSDVEPNYDIDYTGCWTTNSAKNASDANDCAAPDIKDDYECKCSKKKDPNFYCLSFMSAEQVIASRSYNKGLTKDELDLLILGKISALLVNTEKNISK